MPQAAQVIPVGNRPDQAIIAERWCSAMFRLTRIADEDAIP